LVLALADHSLVYAVIACCLVLFLMPFFSWFKTQVILLLMPYLNQTPHGRLTCKEKEMTLMMKVVWTALLKQVWLKAPST
jgi:hypothetical protein